MTAIDPLIVDQVAALLAGEDNVITNLSNAAALLYNSMDQVNWLVSTSTVSGATRWTSGRSKAKSPARTFSRAAASLVPAMRSKPRCAYRTCTSLPATSRAMPPATRNAWSRCKSTVALSALWTSTHPCWTVFPTVT